jgi:hypothetical protein
MRSARILSPKVPQKSLLSSEGPRGVPKSGISAGSVLANGTSPSSSSGLEFAHMNFAAFSALGALFSFPANHWENTCSLLCVADTWVL